MSDVVSPLPRPHRSLLVALACFAIAGLANAPLALTPRAGLALAATAAGVYAAARFAGSVERLRLVRTSIGFWIVVVTIAVVAASEAGDYGPLSAGVADVAVRTATWTALLAAGATTAFLGFREYGSRVGEPANVEGEIEYSNN